MFLYLYFPSRKALELNGILMLRMRKFILTTDSTPMWQLVNFWPPTYKVTVRGEFRSG